MAWSLLKDTLEFVRRHLLTLVLLVLPVQIALALVFEVSGLQDYMANIASTMNTEEVASVGSSQGLEATDDASLEEMSSESILDGQDDSSPQGQQQQGSAPQESLSRPGELQDSPPETESVVDSSLSTGSVVLAFVYGILSLLPIALVIVYVQSVFANAQAQTLELYSRALPLMGAMICFYVLVWGGLLAGFAILHTTLSLALPSAKGPASILLFVYFGFCLYAHHRLSLAPYFWVQSSMSVPTALKMSWREAQPVVFTLLFGNCILYVGLLVVVSLLMVAVRALVPEQMEPVARVIEGVSAGVGGVVLTVFVYRVYAFLEESARRIDSSDQT